jgi:aryl-alcohol dehydrogenase-like predicted oxidoreductase
MYEGYARYIGSPGGVSEEILGQALKGRRDQVVLATEVGMKIDPAELPYSRRGTGLCK